MKTHHPSRMLVDDPSSLPHSSTPAQLMLYEHLADLWTTFNSFRSKWTIVVGRHDGFVYKWQSADGGSDGVIRDAKWSTVMPHSLLIPYESVIA